MANQKESTKETKDQVLESNTATSTSAPREAGQVANQLSGNKSTVLDSTVETSTTAPRSVEQIMEEMKEEDNKKNSATASKAKSSIKSTFDKWKAAGVNARKAVDDVGDAVEGVKDVVDGVEDVAEGNLPGIDDQRGSVSSPVATAATALAVGTSIYNATVGGDQPGVDQSKTVPAPSDSAIISFQQHQTQAQLQGAHAKKLEYTDAQQTQWNAQDQYRMYSNYGDMYEHGQNEINYNMAILNSAMAMHAPAAKQLPPVPSFRQKFLAEVAKDDDQMDINNLTPENMFAHSAELLNVGPVKEASENLSFINSQGRDAQVQDQYEAVDHNLNDRVAKRADVESKFAHAMEAKNDQFMSNVSKRLASLNADLGLDQLQSTSPTIEDEFF